MKRIVFVCSGNICRSPMAAEIARAMLERAKIPAMVLSAGTLGINGSPAADHAGAVLAERGLSLAGHRSQGVSRTLLQAASHVVVMAPEHAAFLLGKDPGLAHKIVRLWEHATPAGRLELIADPVGQDRAAFAACRDELEACLGAWIAGLGQAS